MANSFNGHNAPTVPCVYYQEGSIYDTRTLNHGASAFRHRAQQAPSDITFDTGFDVSQGTWSGTTLQSVQPGQEWNSFLRAPRAMDHDASINDFDNEYHAEYYNHNSSVVSQYSIDQALEGLSSGLVVPDPPYPQTIVDEDLSSTSTSPQQQPSSAHCSISHLSVNVPPILQPPDILHDLISSRSDAGPANDSDTTIGSFHHSGRFRCLQQSCVHKSFGRQAELRRHHDTIHAVQKPEYWCQVATCHRSQVNGDHPFPRRDKMTDHVRKVHGRS